MDASDQRPRYRNGLEIWPCECVVNVKGVHRLGCPDTEMYQEEDGERRARLRATQPPTIKAADLPAGSVVAAWADSEPDTGRALYGTAGEFSVIFHRTDSRTVLGGGYPWVTADLPARINPDAEVQRALDAGAQVLRVGDGKEEG